MRTSLAVAVWLVMTAVAVAQVPPVPARTTGYVVEIHAGPTIASPLVGPVRTILNAEWVCDLPRLQLPVGPMINPGRIRFDDEVGAAGGPGHAGRDCEAVVVAWFRSLPAGTGYSAWMMTLTDAGGGVPGSWELALPSFSIVAEVGPPSPPRNIRLFVVAQ